MSSIPLSAAEMKTWVLRQYVIDPATSATSLLDNESWDFLCENSVLEVVDKVLELVRGAPSYDKGRAQNVFDQCQKYFGSIPADFAKQYLYSAFADAQTCSFAYETIVALNLFDFDRVNALLLSEDSSKRKNALRLFDANKDFYSQDDIPRFQRCLVTIDDAFKKTLRK